MGKWIVAKYIRLSQADCDLKGNGRKHESESISHQRDMLETYIAGHSDLAECEQMEFMDDGFERKVVQHRPPVGQLTVMSTCTTTLRYGGMLTNIWI